MFIATYIYPNSTEVFMGKVSIFNYFAVALTSLKPFLRRHRLVIKPIKWAERLLRNVQCFPEGYKDYYSRLSADPRYTTVRWVAPWHLCNYLESKDYIEDWAFDHKF